MSEAAERLHKRLAQAGCGSRRAIEDWIRARRITVNGELKDEKTSTGVNAQTFCLVKSA